MRFLPFSCYKISKSSTEGHEKDEIYKKSNNEIVKLNIGGSKFQTSKSTLTKFDGFFKAMLEAESSSKCYFIDRCPKHFEKILNFMRDGKMDIPDSEEDRQEILREAEFYKLTGLVAQLTKNQKCVRNLKDDEAVLNAILTSTKKAVLVIYYVGYGGGMDSTGPMAKYIMKYSEEFDVYLKYHYPLDSWRFDIFDNETRKIYSGAIDQLETTISEAFILLTRHPKAERNGFSRGVFAVQDDENAQAAAHLKALLNIPGVSSRKQKRLHGNGRLNNH